MNKRRSGVLLMILGVILAIAVGSTMFLTAQQASKQGNVEMAQVLIATQEIPERTPIQPAGLAVKSMPVDMVPVGALVSAEEAVGKMAITRIFPNEVILTSKLADTEGQSGISYTIEQGQVVITFPASDIVSTGAVKPGDTIDLLVTLKPDEQAGSAPSDFPDGQVTQLTLQNLRVLGIGSLAAAVAADGQAAPKGAGSLFTFAVPREDALALKALKDAPNVVHEVVLRAAGDEEIVTTDAVTVKELADKYGIK